MLLVSTQAEHLCTDTRETAGMVSCDVSDISSCVHVHVYVLDSNDYSLASHPAQQPGKRCNLAYVNVQMSVHRYQDTHSKSNT